MTKIVRKLNQSKISLLTSFVSQTIITAVLLRNLLSQFCLFYVVTHISDEQMADVEDASGI